MGSPVQVFADNLKLIRKARKLTQTQLADKVGLTKQSIINYEKGLTFPTGNRMQNLLEALGITAEQLLGKELLQSDAERQMINLCLAKARYFADYQFCSEEGSEEDVREFLLQHLSGFNRRDLSIAIAAVYERRISEAQQRFIEEATDSYSPERQCEGMSIDLPVALMERVQEGEDSEE